MDCVYAWGPRFRIPGMPVLDRKGQLCRVVVRGGKNSVMVEFEDGEQYVVSRYAVRLAKRPTKPQGDLFENIP